jgi:hypothetical protein
MLSHRDVILNRSLSQLSPQENHLEYHIISTLTQRRTIHASHGQTQPLGDDSTLTQRRTMPHHMGMPNTGLSHGSTQLNHRRERILEDVSRRCNHQHNMTCKNPIKYIQNTYGFVENLRDLLLQIFL